MRSEFHPMIDVIPEGTKGNARVEHVRVSKNASAFTAIRAMAHGLGEYVREGEYAQLYVGNWLVMSDTSMEKRSNRGVLWNARGDVLIAGLGLGMILLPLLEKPEVKSILVIEKSQDVIDLVEPHIRKAAKKKGSSKLTVVCADIFEWAPPKGQKWDTIYFDIWGDISTDSLKDMGKLHRKFGRRKNPGGWMNSWKRAELKLELARQRRQRWGY